MVPYRLSLTHTNFAAQLESIGLWHWAVFVLLHIEEAEARETAVRHVLARNCQLEPDEEEQEKEQFVSEKLLGSDEWLHEAKVGLCFVHVISLINCWYFRRAVLTVTMTQTWKRTIF